MWKEIFIFCLGINLVFGLDMLTTNGNGKYMEILIDRVENIMESPEIAEWHLKVRKFNKTRGIFGYITISNPLGNDVQIQAKILKKQGGEYRYLPYRIPRDGFCDFCKNDQYIYEDFAKNSDFPEDVENNCPFPPGNYTFFGASANPEKIPGSILPSGEYAFEWSFYKDDNLVSQYKIYCYVNNI